MNPEIYNENDIRLVNKNKAKDIWIADSAKVDLSARIYGPAVIMDDACISKNAVILGPTVIGRNTSIGPDSLVTGSVLWDGAQIGENCEIQRCVIDYNAVVRDNTLAQEQSIPFEDPGMLKSLTGSVLKVAAHCRNNFRNTLQPLVNKLNDKFPSWNQPHKGECSAGASSPQGGARARASARCRRR